MSDTRGSRAGGIGLCGAMFLLFLGLRLTEHIDWSWYWVAAPLWVPVALVLAVVSVIGVVMLFGDRAERRRRANMTAAARAHEDRVKQAWGSR